MPNLEDLIRESKAAGIVSGQDAARGDLDVAIEYSEGDMLNDVRDLLLQRYPHTQSSSDARQHIAPLCVPLFQRYLDESATAYTQGVRRTVVDDAGEVNEDLTKQFNDALAEVGYDQMLATLDRRVVGLKSAAVFYQTERGQLDPIIFGPQDVYPLADPMRGGIFNRANPLSYAGFTLDTSNDHVVASSGAVLNKTFAFVSTDEIVIYKGKGPLEHQNTLSRTKNPYTWPLPVIDGNGRPTGTVAEQRISPLVIWHGHRPDADLLPLHTPSMLTANRELNVLWSVLFDVIRFQGGATPVIEKMNPGAAEAFRVMGVRHPAIVRGGGAEGVTYASAPNNYTGLVSALQAFNRLMALAHRMSPGDFSVEQSQAQSGFAKLVENLPKIDGRKQRIKWYSIIERRSFPVVASILLWLRKVPESIKQHRLAIEYDNIEIPRSADERIREEEHDFKHGIRTPAQVLSGRAGIPVEEAQERVRENRSSMPARSILDAGGRPPPGAFAATVANTGDEDESEDE